MKSRRKSLIRFGVVVLAISLIAAVYWHFGLFPGRLKARAMQKIEAWTGKKVQFEKVIFVPLHGLSLYHVGVFEKNGAPIFQAKRITINARILPFLNEKKILINRLLLESPSYDMAMHHPAKNAPPAPPKTIISGQIDIPTVEQQTGPRIQDAIHGPDIFLPENVYIERIEISNGYVTVRPLPGAPVAETLSSVNIRMTLPTGPFLRFDGRVEIGRKVYASVNLTGTWDLEKGKYEFLLRTKSDYVPSWLLEYQKNNFLILKQGKLSFETRLSSGGASGFLFKTKAMLSQAVIQASASSYSGQMRLEAEGFFDNMNKKFQNYRGSLELLKVDAQNLSPAIQRLSGLSGVLQFQPDMLWIKSIRGLYKKAEFDASGTIQGFKELILNGEIRTQLSIDEMMSLLPQEYSSKLKDFAISGQCRTATVLSGSLKKGAKLQSQHKVVVENASLRNDAKKIKISRLFGEAFLDQKGVRIHNARFNLGEKPFSVSAYIPSAENSPGKITLKSSDLSVQTTYKSAGNRISLTAGQAYLPGMDISFSGTCEDLSKPWIQISGQSSVALQKALDYFKKSNPSLKNLDLRGNIQGPFTLTGLWEKPMDWDVQMDAQGESIGFLKNFIADKIKVQIRYKNRLLDIPFFHASGYDGTFRSNFKMGLFSKNGYFQSRHVITNLNLEKIALNLSPPNKELKGFCAGELKLSGFWLRPETFTGNGSLIIRDGVIWKTDQFKPMGHLPLVKVQGLDWVTFERMDTTFQIKDSKIFTQGLSLFGDAVDLSLRGFIGFDQTLDMKMNIQYSNAVIEGAAITGGLAPIMVNQAANFISEYKIGGTLKKPTFEKIIIPSGQSVGKKLTDVIRSVI